MNALEELFLRSDLTSEEIQRLSTDKFLQILEFSGFLKGKRIEAMNLFTEQRQLPEKELASIANEQALLEALNIPW